MTEYVTSEEHVPDDASGEVTLQVTDTETREIFVTRARLARDADALEDPDPLTVVRGPHENIEEQWYIDVLEANVREAVDRETLERCYERARTGSNVINARSEDLRALLLYLVETGEYDSVSEAVREILGDHVAAERPRLLEAYADLKADEERERLAETFEDR